MLFLQAITPQELQTAVGTISIEEARRVVGAIHRHGQVPKEVRNVRRDAIERIRCAGRLPTLAITEVRRSRFDPFVKFSLEGPDGDRYETVRIPLNRPGRYSVCVSSQAGCALGCVFCATGRQGLRRNLATWEIVEQVRVVRRSLDRSVGERVHGVVFQGMGEPLANTDAVIGAIRVLSEPSALAVSARAITVCTAGLPEGIRRLAREVPAVRLAVSIGSTNPGLRLKLMPIQQAFPLHDVLDAAAEHARRTRLSPMWSYTLLDGVNDSDEEAAELVRLARSFEEETGQRPRISVVAYNGIDTSDVSGFSRSDVTRESAFRKVLSASGLPSHRRYSGGSDVRAACGQLIGRVETGRRAGT